MNPDRVEISPEALDRCDRCGAPGADHRLCNACDDDGGTDYATLGAMEAAGLILRLFAWGGLIVLTAAMIAYAFTR